MKTAPLALLFTLALALPGLMSTVWAQGTMPRIKGRIVDFDGLTFHLAPESGPILAIRLQAHTQFMTTQKLALASISVGAYAGATVTEGDGALTAEEVHLYPDTMRGSSEGRIGLSGNRLVVTGAVTAIAPGSLTLFYRGGATVNGVCQGRAEPGAASPACSGDPVIHVPAEVPVTVLAPADRRLLVPGAIATVTVETDAKGARSTPGLILEKP
jgi:hypothetical protein